jgi:ABC-type glycerol-3-phosphate transport system substrate-binding protein
VSQANVSPVQQTAPASSPGDSNPVTITFGAQDWERSSFQKVIDRFNSENPDVHVQFVSLDAVYTSDSNADVQLQQIVSAADTASVFNVTRHAIQSGYVLDLAPLMQADRSFDPADFYPGALESVSLEGRTYMLPRIMWLQLLSYNKDLWDRAGLAVPKPDWSWDDLVRAAEQLARKRVNKIEVYGMIDWGGFGILDGLLSQSSRITPLATRDGEGRFDQPELLAALKRVEALAENGGLLVPNQTEGQWRQPEETIKAQEVGIWWQGMYPDASQEKQNFSIGILPLPRSKEGVQRFSQGYVISSGTQHPEACWRWLSFLSRQQVDRPVGLSENVSSVPARKSIAKQSGYWDKLDPETRTVIEAALSAPTAPSIIRFDARYTSALARAVDRVTSGKQTPEEALREARSSYEQALVEHQQTPQSAEARPIIVATPQPEVAIATSASKVRFGSFSFDQAALRKQADEFNRSQAEVFVEIVEPERGGEGMVNPNVGQLAAVSDAFLWYGLLSPQELTATQDLQPLIDADPEFRLDDYPPALLGAFQQNGKLIGLPRALDLRVVQYNRKAFEQAGVEPPAANWTLDELIDKAQRLTSGAQPDKRYGFSADGTLGLELVLDASGASLTTEQGGQLKPNFTDPKVVEASRRFIDLARSSSPQQALDGYRSGSFSSSFEQIRQGRVGMWVSYSLSDRMPDSSKMETGIVPPPLGQTVPKPNSDAFDGLYLSAQANDPQAAWKWMKFLSQSASGLGGRFPARSSVAQSEAFLQQAPPGAAEVFRAYTAALAKRPPPATTSSRQQPLFESYWYYRAIDRVLRGETRSLERALEEAQTLTEQFLGCVRAGDTPPNCAKQTDPSYDGFLLMR